MALVALGPVTTARADDPRPPAEAIQDWATVLEAHVDDQGRTDFVGLSRDRAALDRYVAWVAEVGPNTHPDLFPTRNDVIAHYVNAYNALAMHGILERDFPEDFDGRLKRLGFFILRGVEIDGDRTNLFAFEREVIIPLGDPRTHFALNCMVVDCPILPRVPFSPETLDEELERVTREFFNEARNVRVDHTRQRVILSELLKFYDKEFEDETGTPIAYVNRYHDGDTIPDHYEVEFRKYDWRVNYQPGKNPNAGS